MYELFVIFALMTPTFNSLEIKVSTFQFGDACETAADTLRGMTGSSLVGETRVEIVVTASCVSKTRAKL